MRIIHKLQRGDVIASDNTKVVRPEVHEPVKAKPRQYSIVDLGGALGNTAVDKLTGGWGEWLEGRNLLAKYIFDENPIVRRAFFNKDIKNIKPISKNESKRSFSHGDRYGNACG